MLSSGNNNDKDEFIKVVVIGGGVAGLAYAAMISKDPKYSVTIIESHSDIGGPLYRSIPSIYLPSEDPEYLSAIMKLVKEKMYNLTEESVRNIFSDIHKAYNYLLKANILLKLKHQEYSDYVADEWHNVYGHTHNNFSIHTLFFMFLRLINAIISFFSYSTAQVIKFVLDNPYNIVKRLAYVVKTNPRVNILLNSRFYTYKPIIISSQPKHIIFYENMSHKGELSQCSCDVLVFASGGYMCNKELMKDVFGYEMKCHAYSSFHSESVYAAGLSQGVTMSKKPMGWYAECIDGKQGQSLLAGWLLGDSMVVLNRQGHRVYNEKSCYAHRGLITLREGFLLLICDRRCMKEYIQAINRFISGSDTFFTPDDSKARYVCGTSLSQLIEHMQTDFPMEHQKLSDDFLTNATRELESFGSCSFKDRYHRGETHSDRMWHLYNLSDNINENKTMMPLSCSELYATVLRPSLLDTCFGFPIDDCNRVVNDQQVPFPGVYAIGNCADNPLHGLYISPGLPISCSIMGAYRAFRSLSAGSL